MHLFNIFHAACGKAVRQMTALVLVFCFAAAYFVSPAGEMYGVYAEESQSAPSSETPAEQGGQDGQGEQGGEESPVLAITSQPQDVTVSEGEKATFTVGATGTGLKYQWYYRKAGARSWSVWNGHTAASTSALANSTWNLMKVYCRVSDGSGRTVSSQYAVVKLRQPLTILKQPEDITVTPDSTARFSVTAQGTGKISYQWYVRKVGSGQDVLWNGHITATTTASANSSWNGMKVWCVVTDEAGASVRSDAASVTVQQPLTIVTQPEDVTVKPDETVKFRVAAQGTGKISYQWYYKKFGAEGWSLWKGHISAVTTAKANSTWNLMQIYCRLSDETGASADSQPAVVRVDQPLTILTQPADKTVTGGRTAEFTVIPQGKGLYTYQWYRRMKDDRSWSVWQDQTAAVLSFKAEQAMDQMKVYCRVKDESGINVSSKSALLTVVPAIRITSQPAQLIVHSGETAKFSVEATGSGITYQWYYKKAGKTDWTLWDGKTEKTVSGTADCTWHVMQVFCRVTDETGETADSDVALAMITKKSDKRYIKRTFKVKSNGTKIYSGPGTEYNSLGTLNAGAKYLALEWGSDSNDVTWFRFNWKGKNAWISRKKTSVSDEFVTIPSRSFKDGGVPIIYLSPSRQIHNPYAAGGTTEQKEMYRVGEALKKILEEEYLCVVYLPPVSMTINLNGRPQDAYDKEADVYLAIHSNASTTKNRYGAVGYYFPACDQSKALGKNMAEEMHKISPFTPNTGSDNVNGMTAFDNIGYGEVRDPAYFGMISLLAEVEFHNNADSAKWIINNPEKIARALANALEKTLDMQKK